MNGIDKTVMEELAPLLADSMYNQALLITGYKNLANGTN